MRENPFIEIYRKCNHGSPKEKLNDLKESKGENVPEFLDVELTNNCNFHCLMCPSGTGAMRRKKGFMSDEVMNRIVEDVAKYNVKGVRLIGWGEPTLHPKFFTMLEKLKKTGTLIHFNTNGSLLSEDDLKRIIELEVDSMKFSFQGVDELSYGEMRRGGEFSDLIQRMKKLYELRGDKDKPFIQVSTTITNESEESVQKFEKLVREYSDYYNVGRTKLSHINVDDMKISDQDKELYLKLKGQETNNKIHTVDCSEIYQKLSIGWDGGVTICCSDYNHELEIGNIIEDDLKTLYHNHIAMEMRENISKNDFEKYSVCKKCYGFMVLN